jgi:hypothetical protein
MPEKTRRLIKVYKVSRVEKTTKKKRAFFKTEEERAQGRKIRYSLYYQKYKHIAQRKQRIRYAKKKLIASGIRIAGR